MKKSRSLQSWYPHENDEEKSKCKLTCYSRESREFYQTGENVVDGTRCSYDRPNDICVQGKCVPLGCDMVSFILDYLSSTYLLVTTYQERGART